MIITERISDIRQALRLNFKSQRHFVSWMKAQGYSELGSGAYSVVFEHENLPYALKVYRKDGCYTGFVDYVLANQNNPHLPRLKRPIHVPDKVSVVAIEKLFKVAAPVGFDEFVTMRDFGGNPTWGRAENRALAQQFAQENPSLAQTITDIYGQKREWCVADLHDKNIMRRRDGTIVITDPWAT